jgi:predicted nucleotidyltransferase
MVRRIEISKERVEEFCRRNHIRSLSLFGSTLREDFRPDSDIDILVEFEQGQEPSLMKIAEIENELSAIIGRKVDLVERKGVERSENYIRRRHILQSLETIYVA